MATITANVGTNVWNTNGAWVGSVQPTAADDVVIPNSATVTIGNGVTAVCRSLTIQNGGAVNPFNSSTTRLNIGDGTAGASNKALDVQSGGAVGGAANALWSFISTSATQQTITTNGATLPSVVIDGAGSNYILGDALISSTNFVLTAGTFDTGSYNLTASGVASTDTSTRVLTLGSSAISCNSWAMRSTGITITANTATLTQNGSNSTFDNNAVAGCDYNGLSLVQSGAGQAVLGFNSGTIAGSTLANYTRTGTAAKTNSLLLAMTTLTVTGTFTLNSNSDINKLLVLSNLAGTARKISAATAVITNTVDFIDITGAGTATWTAAGTGATYLGDGQGNSGITFTTPATQTISSGSWDNAANWTSRIPLPQDDVIVTGSSAITINQPRLGRNLDFSGYSGTATLTSFANQYWIFGNITLGASMTYGSNPNTFSVNLAGRGTHTITSNGKTFFDAGSNQTVTVAAPGGSYSLADDFSLRNVTNAFTFSVNAGTFNSNNYSINCGRLVISGTPTKVVNFGTSTITLRIGSAGSITIVNTALTLDANNATFIIETASASTRTIELGGAEIGTLNYTVAGSTGALSISSSGTIRTLNFSDASNARTLQITGGQTLTVDNFNVFGGASRLIKVQSSSTALARLSNPNGTIYNSLQDYISYEYIQPVQPQSLWLGANSSQSNCLGILTSEPTYKHKQSTAAALVTATSTTVSYPNATTAGNLLVAYFASAGTQGTFTPPSGWTQAVTSSNGSIGYIFYKVADGTETNVEFSQTTARAINTTVVEYSGFSGTPTLDATDSNSSGTAVTSLSTTATTGPTNTAQPALALAMVTSSLTMSNTVSISNSFLEDRTLTVASTLYKGAVKELTSLAAVDTTFTWTSPRAGTAAALAVFKNVVSASTGNFLMFF